MRKESIEAKSFIFGGNIFLHPFLVEIVYMMKKILMFATALSAGAFAQVSSIPITLDVIVRDFQPSHPDFENFSEEAVNHMDAIYGYNKPGYDADWYNRAAYHNSCGNKESFAKYQAGVPLGKDGLPWIANTLLPPYLQKQTASPAILTYGQCLNSAIPGVKNQRGFGSNKATQFKGVIKNTCSGGMYWENDVVYTPGMVKPYLTFDMDEEGNPLYLEGAHIHKLGEACDNSFFEQWFEDVGGINKRSNLTLDIPTAADDPKYKELDYNYNNGGYFPLDVVNPASQKWLGSVEGTDQFGPQSFSIFCPPYNYQHASMQDDFLGQNTYALCLDWLNYGGPRALTAEQAMTIATSNGNIGVQHLRNYNFTMMGYANFRYYKANNTDELNQEIFEFAGDDDMWIFVDGVLAVDLGGTHLATPGIVNIRELAMNNHGCNAGEPLAAVQQSKGACAADGWTDGSWHHLHFFYADRQSDGSNLYIRANLAEVAASAYGQPRILEAELVKNDAGNFDTYIYVSSQLSDETVNLINAANGQYFPILTKRGMDTLAYQITGFKYVQRTSKGYSYEIKGKLCKDALCTDLRNPAFGDSLAFNHPANDVDPVNSIFASVMQVFSKTGKAVDTYHWGPVTTVTMSQTTTIVPADTTIDRPPFDDSRLPSGELSDKQTGEIVVSVLPPSYANAEDQGAWIADSLKHYTQAPSIGGDGKPVPGSSIINSTTGGAASSNATALCGTDAAGTENCVSFSFTTDEAFRVNVRIFDHLGHFVNQYNQELSTEQFNAITGSYAPTDCSLIPETTMGTIAASVKMYPVSKNGRKLGTGAYIYQISLIEFPQPHCTNVGGELNWSAGTYRRTEYKQTRGFRRITE